MALEVTAAIHDLAHPWSVIGCARDTTGEVACRLQTSLDGRLPVDGGEALGQELPADPEDGAGVDVRGPGGGDKVPS